MSNLDAKGKLLNRARSILFLMPAWFAPHTRLRVLFHKWRGVKIGKNVEIGYFCVLDNVHPYLVTIEDNAVITLGVTILAHDNAHYYTYGKEVRMGKTRIKNNAFIGINAVIMPGVTIGASAIIGANSVVTKDVKDKATVVGAPAKEI